MNWTAKLPGIEPHAFFNASGNRSRSAGLLDRAGGDAPKALLAADTIAVLLAVLEDVDADVIANDLLISTALAERAGQLGAEGGANHSALPAAQASDTGFLGGGGLVNAESALQSESSLAGAETGIGSQVAQDVGTVNTDASTGGATGGQSLGGAGLGGGFGDGGGFGGFIGGF